MKIRSNVSIPCAKYPPVGSDFFAEISSREALEVYWRYIHAAAENFCRKVALKIDYLS